jgi:hypothetical protein
MQSAENPTTTNDNDQNDDDQPVPERVLRWLADTMCLGGLCARTKCRRAMACRGEPRECLARYAPLVPEEARDGVKAMIEGLMRGVDFDTMRNESEDSLEALREWTELVQHSRTGWTPRAGGQ